MRKLLIILAVLFALAAGWSIIKDNSHNPPAVGQSANAATIKGDEALANIQYVNSLDCQLPNCAKVPGHQWVEVMNPNGIQNGNSVFAFRDRCSIDEQGVVKKVSQSSDRTLIKFESDRSAAGAMCPSGTIFFVDRDEFNSMTQRHDEIQRWVTQEKELVKELLREDQGNRSK